MAVKKFYAIAVGRHPGIYDNWPLAHAQVMGFPGARYKGFPSRSEAEAWLDQPASSRALARPKAKVAATPTRSEQAPNPGEVLVYSDGGARFNPGPGGYGVIIIADGERRELSGGYRHTTNNRMELMGCIVALDSLADCSQPITVTTDSQYVVNGISKGWAKGWRKRGWLKADRQPALNADLWGRLLELTEGRPVAFCWVRGHAGHPENERCDQLAVAAAAQPGLPVDQGYEGAV
ncbi:MAG: ribonuclease HI [Desulfobulbaceae bacterium]|nr:ribonuclease HI [Desulfobulbaceae bacterium]